MLAFRLHGGFPFHHKMSPRANLMANTGAFLRFQRFRLKTQPNTLSANISCGVFGFEVQWQRIPNGGMLALHRERHI